MPEPLPERLLYVERLRRRMRVRFGSWIADSEHVLLLFEPGRYPVAYFPETDVSPHVLERTEHITQHRDLGLTSWYSVRADQQHIAPRGAWQHTNLPGYASELQAHIAFAWRAMDAFYEEDERVIGHAADPYHRIDIRQASRNLVIRHHDRIIADTKRPLVLYESGFAPRWYVPRADIDQSALTPVERQSFCPYKGLCSYYSVDDAPLAAWSYPEAYPEVRRISNWCRSSRTLSRYISMAHSSILSRARGWFRTAPIAT